MIFKYSHSFNLYFPCSSGFSFVWLDFTGAFGIHTSVRVCQESISCCTFSFITTNCWLEISLSIPKIRSAGAHILNMLYFCVGLFFFVLSRCFILHSLPGTRLFSWLIICAAIEKRSSSVYNTHCHCRLLRLVISFCLLLTASRLRKENLRYNDYFNQTTH